MIKLNKQLEEINKENKELRKQLEALERDDAKLKKELEIRQNLGRKRLREDANLDEDIIDFSVAKNLKSWVGSWRDTWMALQVV
jgi:hypothetical protein